MSRPFRVLLVCEGNVCRSPWAAVVFRRSWPASAPQLVVESAGTHAARGRGAHPMLASLCQADAERAALAQHRARRVDGSLLRGQDLVLVAERRQRSDLLESWPAALHRTFTIGEVERLVRLHPLTAAERALPLHDVLARRRHPLDAVSDDLDDPVHGTLDDFRRMADRLDQSLGVIVPFAAAVALGDTKTEGPA